ncbi:MAG: response regulator transcription factor [Chloroflexi bacterium]|nr:MAG: response regulator transcription factor [Chloroflexota bacterium]
MPGRSGSIAARATGRASSFDSRGRPVSTNAVRAEPTGARLLVVDDEPSMIRTLRTNLRGHGFQVETAETAGDAIASYERRQPDLVVLDLNLPDGDGFEVVRRIRELSGTPIIVLSARGGEHDKVNALDLGADDYMTKPFGIDELLARIRVALRHVARPPAGAEPRVVSGDLVVDLERREVSVGDREVHLTPTEYDLLKVFVTNPNKVLTDRMLLQQVWGPDYGDESHYLHVYVARLRRKIEHDPQDPTYLMTEPGIGYRFRSEEL